VRERFAQKIPQRVFRSKRQPLLERLMRMNTRRSDNDPRAEPPLMLKIAPARFARHNLSSGLPQPESADWYPV
jgi:hypothetical protein